MILTITLSNRKQDQDPKTLLEETLELCKKLEATLINIEIYPSSHRI